MVEQTVTARYLEFWLLCVPGGKLPESWLQPRIVLLDVGMVTRLSNADQHNMVNLFQSLLGMDGRGIAKAVLSFSGKPVTCTMSHQPAATAFLTWHCWSTEHKAHSRLRPDDYVSQRGQHSWITRMLSLQKHLSSVTVQQVTSRHVQTHAPLRAL